MSEYQPPPPIQIPRIGFSIPLQGNRPGIITSIGIMSVIVGSLALLGSFVVGESSTQVFDLARIAANAQASAAASAMTPPILNASNPANPASSAGPTVSPDDGLSAEASKRVAAGVHAIHRLAQNRRVQLEHFLQQAGQVSGFGDGDDTSHADVRKVVLEDRTMPPVTPGALPTDVIVTAFGRVEIYDEGVAFMPSDGSPAMRTTIGTPGVTAIGAGANPAASGALTTTEAQAITKSLQAGTPDVLNSAQVATLIAALQRPGQTLVKPGSTSSQDVSAYAYDSGNGSVTVALSGGNITMDAAGKETAQATAAATFAAPIMSVKVNMSAFAAVILESILSGVLGAYLVASGILMLRQSMVGAKLHWIYVGLKVPLAVGGAIALPWLWYSIFNSIRSGMPGGGSFAVEGYVIFGVITGVLALAYPVALIFALSGRAVHGYYNSVGKMP